MCELRYKFVACKMSSGSDDEVVITTGGRRRSGKKEREGHVRPMRGMYGQHYYGLAVDDLLAVAKSKVTIKFMREFNRCFSGPAEARTDALVLALARNLGLEPFGLTCMRVPGATPAMLQEQQSKLRQAASMLATQFAV